MNMLLRIDPTIPGMPLPWYGFRHFGPKRIVAWLGGGLLFLFSIHYSLFDRVHYYFLIIIIIIIIIITAQ